MATEAAALTDLPPCDKDRTDGERRGSVVINPMGTDCKLSQKKQRTNIDSGWAWVVLLASFLIHAVLFGTILGIGLFYSEFLDEFQKGPVETSWIIATNVALGCLLGPVGSVLANRFGFRLVIFIGTIITATGYIVSYFIYDFWLLFLAFGILAGAGSGLVYSPSFGVLALYFDKRKTLATSAATVGIGIGMFALPPLQRILIANTTWRGASLVTGALNLNIIPLAALFSRHPRTSAVSFSQYADISLFHKATFFVIIAHFFLMSGFNIFLIMTVRFATEFAGIPKDDAPVLLSTQGICNILGRLVAVAVSTIPWTSRKPIRFFVFHLFTLGGAVVVILFSLCDTLLGLCVCTGLAGFFLGSRWALLPGLQMDTLKAERFSTSWSYGMFLLGTGSLIMPPFGEWIALLTNDGRAPFIVGGISIFIACGCMFIIQCCPPHKRHRQKSLADKLIL